MGIGDWTVFPGHLDSPEEVKRAFPDDDQMGWFGKIRKRTKHWGAFSPRSPKGIAWTCLPVGLLVIYAGFIALGNVAVLIWGGEFAGWGWYVPFLPFPVARKWRDRPVILWARKKGGGAWRFESIGDGPDLYSYDDDPRAFLKDHPNYYLTRAQLWARNTKFLAWPFFWNQVRYKDTAEVLPVAEYGDRDGQIDMFYAGCKLDDDWIYWLWAFFRGENFK